MSNKILFNFKDKLSSLKNAFLMHFPERHLLVSVTEDTFQITADSHFYSYRLLQKDKRGNL